jgi:hypothetical protein
MDLARTNGFALLHCKYRRLSTSRRCIAIGDGRFDIYGSRKGAHSYGVRLSVLSHANLSILTTVVGSPIIPRRGSELHRG